MSDSNYLSPGVYIQELEGPAPITGVSTSIAAFIGMAERGPVNFPIPCTSPGDYTRWFGGLMVPDEFADPADPKRFHCYLPYAVAGFFNNSGQIAYVIRVLPDEATAAGEYLYDRTGSSPIASALVRSSAIGDGGGATLSTGALIMLTPAPSGNIRVDDGSVSEYATVQASTAVNEAVALDLPLGLSHAQATPVAPYARATQGTPPYTLLSNIGAGQNVIAVQSADPLNTYNDLLIELDSGDTVVVAVPLVVVPIAPNQYSITLTQPLSAEFLAASTVVTALVASPAAAYSAAGGPYTLTSAATAGDPTLAVTSTAADDLTTFSNWPLELENGGISTIVTVASGVAAGPPGSNEYTLTLAAPLPMDFAVAGTTLTRLNSTPAFPLDIAASGGDMLIFTPGGAAAPDGQTGRHRSGQSADPRSPHRRERQRDRRADRTELRRAFSRRLAGEDRDHSRGADRRRHDHALGRGAGQIADALAVEPHRGRRGVRPPARRRAGAGICLGARRSRRARLGRRRSGPGDHRPAAGQQLRKRRDGRDKHGQRDAARRRPRNPAPHGRAEREHDRARDLGRGVDSGGDRPDRTRRRLRLL